LFSSGSSDRSITEPDPADIGTATIGLEYLILLMCCWTHPKYRQSEEEAETECSFGGILLAKKLTFLILT